MGNLLFSNPDIPKRTPVPAGKTRLCVAGWPNSPHVGRAVNLAREIAKADPSSYETWFFLTYGSNLRGEGGDGKGGLMGEIKALMPADDKERLASHKSVPFCWIETPGGVTGFGGRDRFCEWVQKQEKLMQIAVVKEMATTDPSPPGDLFCDTRPGTAQQ
jgi:hypothetical protein